MNIGGLQKLTLIDYPGRLAATVFLAGCNFRCPWCYNPELVLPERIKLHPKVSQEKIFRFLEEKRGLLEGVVICGGEPTIHKDLLVFCQRIKKLDYSVKLDTNGSNPEMLKKLTNENLVDYVAMDIKAPLKMQNAKCKIINDKLELKDKYGLTIDIKINLKDIKKSIEIIKNSGIEYEFRTTVVPTIHTKEDILQIARDISPAKRYFLQNFRPEKTIDPKFEKIKSYPQEFLLEIQKAISPFFETCQIR